MPEGDRLSRTNHAIHVTTCGTSTCVQRQLALDCNALCMPAGVPELQSEACPLVSQSRNQRHARWCPRVAIRGIRGSRVGARLLRLSVDVP
eukprot:361475-Chlamydomonas_euryale.AAC.6